MICPTCGRETGPNSAECPYCRGGAGEVKVLTPDERESFHGVTIDESPADEGRSQYSHFESGGPRSRVYVRQVNLGGKTGWLTKLAILAVIGVVGFVILPMFFLFFAAAGLAWFILSLLRR
jgi:hypothetical protein